MKHSKRTIEQRLATAQSGQVIILMAFGMIALLGVLGLAIDGGRLFYLERDAQNAADAAVMAATYALCTGADPINAGVIAANENGFTGSEVSVTWPVAADQIPAGEDPDEYARVEISADIPSYFIHLVYGGDLAVTTDAIGQCDIAFDPDADGAAIIATHDCTCNNVLSLTGGNEIHIIGGLISNGDIQSTGNNHVVEGSVSYGNACGIRDPKTTYVPDCEPERLDDPISLPEFYDIDDFAPGEPYAVAATNDPAGNRYFQVSGNSIRLEDYPNGGLLYGTGDISVSVGSVTSMPPITIVSTGNIHFRTTGSDIELTPYTESLLFFSDAGTSSCNKNLGIDVTGSVTRWYGLIYAPTAHVQVPGSGAIGEGAVIADTVSIPGARTRIIYNSDVLPAVASTVSMTK